MKRNTTLERQMQRKGGNNNPTTRYDLIGRRECDRTNGREKGKNVQEKYTCGRGDKEA